MYQIIKKIIKKNYFIYLLALKIYKKIKKIIPFDIFKVKNISLYYEHNPKFVENTIEPSRHRKLIGINWLINSLYPISICIGFNDWKYEFMCKYIKKERLLFLNKYVIFNLLYLILIKKIKIKYIYNWGVSDSYLLKNIAKKWKIQIINVEDGPIRSADLGKKHTTPYSLVFDDIGLYYDISKKSKLSNLFDNFLIDNIDEEKINNIFDYIKVNKITKYSKPSYEKSNIYNQKIILIIGQKLNDKSLIYGNPDHISQLDMINIAIKENPNCKIMYRPHPDMVGTLSYFFLMTKCSKLCDINDPSNDIRYAISMATKIYTINSLSGFEAAIQNKKVILLGNAFYSNLGFTDDRCSMKIKRKRKLCIKDAAYIFYAIYPKYFIDTDSFLSNIIITHQKIQSDIELNDSNRIIKSNVLEGDIISSKYYLKTLNIFDRHPDIRLVLKNNVVQNLMRYGTLSAKFYITCVLFLKTKEEQKNIFTNSIYSLLTTLEVNKFIDFLTQYSNSCESTNYQYNDLYKLLNEAEHNTFFLKTYNLTNINKFCSEILISNSNNETLKNIGNFISALGYSNVSNLQTLFEIENIDKILYKKISFNAIFRFYHNPKVFHSIILNLIFRKDPFYLKNKKMINLIHHFFYLDETITHEHIEFALSMKDYDYAELLLEYSLSKAVTHKLLISKSRLYSYTGRLSEAISIIKNLLLINRNKLVYTEYMRLCILKGDYKNNLIALNDAVNKYNIQIGEMHRRKCFLGNRDIGLGMDTYSEIPIIRKLSNYKKNNHIENKKNYLDYIKRKKVLIIAIYGPGDEIRFSSIYKKILLSAHNNKLKFTCLPKLYSLLQRSFPQIEFIPCHRPRGYEDIDNENYSLLNDRSLNFLIDNNVHKLIKSNYKYITVAETLPYYLRDYSDFDGIPCLIPDETKVLNYKNFFTDNIVYVGISWRSMLMTVSRLEHYLCVEDIYTIFDIPGVKFINLQYDINQDEISKLNKYYKDKIIHFSELDQINDLDGVASLMKNLDFVIAPATTVAELAGSIGVKTFLFSNSSELDWRKKHSSNTDTWFKSVEIIGPASGYDKKELVNLIKKRVINECSKVRVDKSLL